MDIVKTRLGANGRVVVPSSIRRQLGLRSGDVLLLRVEDGALVIDTPDAALTRAQRFVARHVPPGVSLADELIKERRKEAARESRRSRRVGASRSAA